MESISRETVEEIGTNPVFAPAVIRPVATFLDQDKIGEADGHDYASGFERGIGETEEVPDKAYEDLLNRGELAGLRHLVEIFGFMMLNFLEIFTTFTPHNLRSLLDFSRTDFDPVESHYP